MRKEFEIDCLGQIIECERKRKNMSRRVLADKAGMRGTTVYNIERGLCTPSIYRAEALLQALGCNLRMVVEDGLN